MSMRLEDAASLRGCLELSITRHGQEIEHYRDDNMIMSSARDALARLIGGDGAGKVVTQIGVGEDDFGPNPNDTKLTNAFIKKLTSHSYPATGSVVFAFSIGPAEANGKTIREFGLICGDGSLFARKTRGAIEKADDIEITGTWTINF
ncbi:MAG: hypothetical protein LBV80_00645 [Deltaproteobacteria bacterium]|nr:hypothetical protein [Deltaproteobacteria bacterium]